MWQVIFFGTIGLLLALAVLNEVRGWRRGRSRSSFDRSADPTTNDLLAQQQATYLGNQSGFGPGGAPGGPTG